MGPQASLPTQQFAHQEIFLRFTYRLSSLVDKKRAFSDERSEDEKNGFRTSLGNVYHGGRKT
jgi:hypothetical protein